MTSRLLRYAVPAVLVGLTAVALFPRLGVPERIFFDETYYVNDARQYLDVLIETSFAVHPPVGKWLIAAGITVLGDDAFAWRVVGAIEASLSVLLVYLMGLRLFRRMWPAALAALLLAADGLWLAQAQTAMLDIHLAFFVVLGAWLLVEDWERTTVVAGQRRRHVPRRRHLLRMLAGVAFGLAVAVKWSGALALLAAIGVVIGVELAQRRRVAGGAFTDLWPAVRSVGTTLVLLPLLVYFLTWIPWLVGFPQGHEGQKICGEEPEEIAACEVSVAERLAGLGRAHRSMVNFHLTLDATHNYRAAAYTWPVLARPVVYYWETCSPGRAEQVEDGDDAPTRPEPCVVEEGDAAEILAVGNPVLWYAFLPATVLLTAGLVRRERRSAFVLAFWGMQFLPWLLVSRPAFLFYMVPVVPFLALGVAAAADDLSRRVPLLWPFTAASLGGGLGLGAGYGLEMVAPVASPDTRWVALGVGWLLGAAVGGWFSRRDETAESDEARSITGRVVGGLVAVGAIGLLVYFYPVWSGLPLDDSAVRARWWFEGWI